ncbi:hypothetical protein [Nocardia brasiliensis]|uniref:hypothetical protein n=1 Tax=Nocardia brasiliensis TaxID=37326 RepID=UPI002458F047|nr:hypothetical protein [Nocardia brasiliensis]
MCKVDMYKWSGQQTAAVRSMCELYGQPFNPVDHKVTDDGAVVATVPDAQGDVVTVIVNRDGRGMVATA